MENHQKKKLLFRYFSGHTTPLEDSVIESWMSDPEFREYFFEILEDWERAHPQFQSLQGNCLVRVKLSMCPPRTSEYLIKIVDNKTSKHHLCVWNSMKGVVLIELSFFFFTYTFI